MSNNDSVFHSDPEILGGEPVFKGTRVPVKTLLDYLENGETIEEFLQGFPSVKREQVIQFLEIAKTNFDNQFGSKLDEPAFAGMRD